MGRLRRRNSANRAPLVQVSLLSTSGKHATDRWADDMLNDLLARLLQREEPDEREAETG